MFKKIYFLGLILIILITGCKNNGNLIETKEVTTFHVGFPTWNIKYFIEKGKEYVAFADFITKKQISINSIAGIQLFTVSLEELMTKEKNGFNDFDIVSLDTFALLSKHSNKVYLINKKGEIIYKKDYSRYLLQNITLTFPFHLNDSNLLVGIDWAPVDSTLNFSQYYRKKHVYYKGAIDSAFYNPENDLYFIFDSIYSRFLNDKQIGIGPIFISKHKKRILLSSIYSDSIYIFDNRIKLDSAFEVSSKFFPIDYISPTFEDEKKYKNDPSFGTTTHSKIVGIKFDRYRKQYYVYVAGSKEKDKYFPYSIIIFNKEYKKIDEIKIDSKKFIIQSFIGRKGLYIRDLGNEYNVIKFTLFRYK